MTGINGLDLYVNRGEEWLWVRPGRSFRDTITYKYRDLQLGAMDQNDGFCQLYLPYFNQVEWLEIGIPDSAEFHFAPLQMEKPIVMYGTSIMHGAFATRPGLTWANILGRKLDHPIINLGFSGNGRLEPELIEAMIEIEAALYILDCLPNLWNEKTYSDDELQSRIIDSVRKIREENAEAPILLVDHAGYTDGFIQPHRKHHFERVNHIQKNVFELLIRQGFSNLYYLSKEKINIEEEGMVDGTHPNDLGMMNYAEAYEQKIREILNLND